MHSGHLTRYTHTHIARRARALDAFVPRSSIPCTQSDIIIVRIPRRNLNVGYGINCHCISDQPVMNCVQAPHVDIKARDLAHRHREHLEINVEAALHDVPSGARPLTRNPSLNAAFRLVARSGSFTVAGCPCWR